MLSLLFLIYLLYRFKLVVVDNIFLFTRLHVLELGTGAYLFFCGCYDIAFGSNHYFIFLFLQAFAFFIVGFGYVGIFVPNA